MHYAWIFHVGPGSNPGPHANTLWNMIRPAPSIINHMPQFHTDRVQQKEHYISQCFIFSLTQYIPHHTAHIQILIPEKLLKIKTVNPQYALTM